LRGLVKVEILGREYKLKSDADEEYVQELARYVNEKIEEVLKNTGTVTTLDVVILTILNIADEFFRLRNERGSIQKGIERRFENLIKLIDSQI
jgi:cell division protein ZapA